MYVYLPKPFAKPVQVLVDQSRRLTRSNLIAGFGVLMILSGCGSSAPPSSTASGSNSISAPTADPIASAPNATTSEATTSDVSGNDLVDNDVSAVIPDRGLSPSQAAPVREPVPSAPLASPPLAPEAAPKAAPQAAQPPGQSRISQGSGVPDVLIPTIDTLRAQTQIPVLLPDRLPLPDSPIYASTSADADRYVIDLGFVPDCRGNACMVGTLAARRGTGDYYELDEPFEMTIELADGTPAYFNPSVCGASCAPPVLEWEYGGARYRVELKGLSEADAIGALAELANSAIAAGDRLR